MYFLSDLKVYSRRTILLFTRRVQFLNVLHLMNLNKYNILSFFQAFFESLKCKTKMLTSKFKGILFEMFSWSGSLKDDSTGLLAFPLELLEWNSLLYVLTCCHFIWRGPKPCPGIALQGSSRVIQM